MIDDYPVDSENMTVVSIPIEDKDVEKFVNAIKEQLWLFNPLPNVKVNGSDFSFENQKLIFEDGDVKIYYAIDDSQYSPKNKVFVDIGGIPYQFFHMHSFSYIHKYFTVVYKQPIGKYELTLSRESISWSDSDKDAIFNEINKSINRFEDFIRKQNFDYWMENKNMFSTLAVNGYTKIKDLEYDDFDKQCYRFGSSDSSNTVYYRLVVLYCKQI